MSKIKIVIYFKKFFKNDTKKFSQKKVFEKKKFQKVLKWWKKSVKV